MEWDEDEEVKINIFRQSSKMQEKRIQSIRTYKQSRNPGHINRVLEGLSLQGKENPNGNWVPAILEAIGQKATLGEISDVLRRIYDFKIPEI